MSLTQVQTGQVILASHHNEIYNLLKGTAAAGESITLIYNAGALIFTPSSNPAAGVRVVNIQNALGTTLASWRYDGLIELLSAAAAPSSPIVGSAYWDSALATLRVYDGANWQSFQSLTAQMPNLVLNSDFSRRTVFGLAMPEVFADVSGDTAITGALGSVAANVLTAGGTGTWRASVGPTSTSWWRDCRMSATFKMVATGAVVYRLSKYVDTSNEVSCEWNNGNFNLLKNIAGTPTTVATVAQAGTLNRFFWLEIEFQGSTVIAKMYDTASAVAGVTKASSTLLQTLTGTVSDAAVATGTLAIISTSGTASQWGGIATGNGGVYVETWLPESWPVDFAGTLGGQAIGYDESSDGPIGIQNPMRAYVPATGRQMNLRQNVDSSPTYRKSRPISPSTAYTMSMYVNTSGASGSGAISLTSQNYDASLANVSGTYNFSDAAETSWTRKTVTATSPSTARFADFVLNINPNTNRTGTFYFMLPQLEMGSAATAWRGAPEDGGGQAWYKASVPVTAPTNTTTTFAEIDSRDLAGNFFFPRDSNVEITFHCAVHNGTINDDVALGLTIDGVSQGFGVTDLQRCRMGVAAIPTPASFTFRAQLAAGKHRIAVQFRSVIGGTSTISNLVDTTLNIVAFVGK